VAHRNRVTPLGELVAHPARGLVFGNRGCLHDDAGQLVRPWQVRRWIACRLAFKERRRPLLQPGRYTELFFLDEATAFAAGHRPCAECRRADYVRFLELAGAGGAVELDERLHAERMDGPVRRLHGLPADGLPDGAFVLAAGRPWLVREDALLAWSPGGYGERRRRPRGDARVLTPPTALAALAAGWSGDVPLFHPSADESGRAAGS
jgi:hypothetical protein